jgi:hypothetical protein
MANQFATREEWLNFVAEEMRPLFRQVGVELPKKIRFSVGFCSTGYRGKVIGECWSDKASADKTVEIFIKPTLDDASRVADILAHELIHAALGTEEGHKRGFQRVMKAIGLKGPAKSTTAGPEFLEYIKPVLKKAGPLPHKALTPVKIKKQSTRLLKCECPECGYVVRVTKKWIEEAGAPYCGRKSHGRMICEDVDDEGGED